jgi:hypothetical protein
MTNRHSGYIVTLRRDIREDDAEEIIKAIGMIKGVLAVKPVEASFAQQIAETRRDEAWRTSLYRLVSSGPVEESG